MRRSRFCRLNSLTTALFAVLILVHPNSFHAAQQGKTESGSLMVVGNNGRLLAPCPLKYRSVKKAGHGVTLSEVFQNPFPDKIEAVYQFALPLNATVETLTISVGERLVTADRQNEQSHIFTHAVTNIMPSEEVKITISYLETTADPDNEWNYSLIPAGGLSLPDSHKAINAYSDQLKRGVLTDKADSPIVTGDINEIVTVTARPSATFSDDATTSSMVKNIRIVPNVPLNSRSVVGLVSIAPGTVTTDGNTHTNGQRSTSNSLTLDGVDINFGINQGGQNPGASAGGTSPALTASGGINGLVTQESTQEIQITTFYVKPEFGRVSGNQVSITSEAGTNNFHGSLFEFFGHDALDATDWFANNRGLLQPPHHLNNYGGTFGGPIKRDTSFFFLSYEGLRLRQPMTAITQVPSLLARQTSAVQPFLTGFPVPNRVADSDNFAEFAGTFSNAARHDAFSIRIDNNFTNELRLVGRYSFADSAADQRGAGGVSLNTTNRVRSVSHSFNGSLSYVVTPNVVFEFLAGYGQLKATGSYVLDDFEGAVVPPAFGSSFTFDLNGRNAKLKTGEEATNTQRQLNLVSALALVSGTHSWKFGVNFRRVMPIIALRPFERSVLFEGVNQSLTGVATRQSELHRLTPQTPHFDNLSVYAQDEWRQTANLMWTYGVRWELNPAPAYDSSVAVDQITDIAKVSLSNPGASLWKTRFSNFAPRLGFAYEMNSRFVFRGGVGVYYDLGSEGVGEALSDSFPILTGSSVFNSPFSQNPLPFQAANILPLAVFDPNLKLPYTLGWHMSVQRSFGYNQSLSVNYFESRGKRLTRTDTLLNNNPAFPFIRLTTNDGRSDYRDLELQFNRSFASTLAAIVSYTLSRSRDNVSQDTARDAFISNQLADYGPSDFDVRHVLHGVASYQLPDSISHGLKNKLLRNWGLSSIFQARSAKTVNVVYGFPTSFGLGYLRPNIVSGQPLYVVDQNLPGGKQINPAAFSIPAGFQQGNLSRNSLRGFPLYQIDMSLRRRFNFTESFAIQVQADAFNVMNHPNFEDPLVNDVSLGTKVDSSSPFRPNLTFGQSASLDGMSVLSRNSFGAFNGTGGARTVRLGVKLLF